MNLGIIVLAVAIIIFVILINIIKIGLKLASFVILAFVLGVTIWICAVQPNMHKPFSIDAIEYLLKINQDGSMTTTKQITKTVIKEQN